MDRVGSALDNAVIESWHSAVEFELGKLERDRDRTTRDRLTHQTAPRHDRGP